MTISEEKNAKLLQDFKDFGLYNNGKIALNPDAITALKNGNPTELINIKNAKGLAGETIPAKLAVYKDREGDFRLRVDPVYKKALKHPLLSKKEREGLESGQIANVKKQVSASGYLSSFGSAPYKNKDGELKKGEKNSFFVDLARPDGSIKTIWGVDLERALNESKHKIGDKVQLDFLGVKKMKIEIPITNDRNEVVGSEMKEVNRHSWEVSDAKSLHINKYQNIEFDKETNQYVSYDPEHLIVPEIVNGEVLTPTMRKRLKDGKILTLADGTQLQLRPSDSKGILSNKSALVLSVLLDGGISYLVISGLKAIFGNKKATPITTTKAHLQALRDIQIELERAQKKDPNNKEIANSLNAVKSAYSNAQNLSPIELTKANEHEPMFTKEINSEQLDGLDYLEKLQNDPIPEETNLREKGQQSDERNTSTGRGR